MQVERVIVTQDWVRDQQRTRTYRIFEDGLGSHYVRYEEQLYTPYSRRGHPVEPAEKGNNVDRMI
jgi:hypothetical protein